MEEQIISPYELLAIGMLTVFVILILVVVTGNLIVWFVNHFLPEKVKEKVAITINSATINPQKMAAIVSAVQVVTKGKGKVVKVEKM